MNKGFYSASDQADFKSATLCLSKASSRTCLCDCAMFTSHFVYWAPSDSPGIWRRVSVHLLSRWNFHGDAYRQGRSESCSWVAAFCFAFVSKQMHSCHSRPHWRLLSNVIASKLIPMDARLQIQLFQVSVKGILQRGMQQKLQIYEFKYRRGQRHYDSHQALLKKHNTLAFILFSASLLHL